MTLLRLWLNAVMAIVLLLSLPVWASAHANLEQSVPLQGAELKESPQEIRVKFTEKINPKLSRLVLEQENGEAIAGQLSSEDDIWLIYRIPKLEPGVYTVKWQNLSVDTHVTEGSFRFSVAAALKTEAPTETISLDDADPQEAPAPAANAQPSSPEPAPAQAPQAEAPKPPQAAPPEPSRLAPPEPQQPQPGESKPVPPASASAAEEQRPADRDAAPPADEGANQAPPSEPSAVGEANADTEPGVGRSAEKEAAEPAPAASQPSPTANDDRHAGHLIDGDDSSGHDHGTAGGNDWRTSVNRLLRIVEIFAAVGLAGFIFFKYMLWGSRPGELPPLFSLRNERRLALLAAVILAGSGIAHIWILAGQLSGPGSAALPNRFMTIVEATMTGKAALLRPLCAALVFAAAFAPQREERFAAGLKSAAVLALLVQFPLTGHAYGLSSGALYAVAAHTVHAVATAVWAGGLVGLLAAAGKRERPRDKLAEIDSLLRRFSLWALPLMIVAAASGLWLTFTRLNSWPELVQSDYGLLILIKSAILLIILAIAGFHRFVLMPQIAAAIEGRAADAKTPGRLLNGIRAELVWAAIAFFIAGILSTTAPPQQGPALEPLYWHVMGDKAHMSLRIDAERRSSQTFRLDVWLPTGIGAPAQIDARLQRSGSAVSEADIMSVPFDFVQGGPDPYGFAGFDKYTYDFKGNLLKDSGPWQIWLEIVDSENQIHRFEKTFGE